MISATSREFVTGGVLSYPYLEIYSYEEEPFGAWPPIEQLTVSRAGPGPVTPPA
ncbi:hypothetical protein ABCR94_24205 [Streptomyces sp. 21So2-11]|uniref:hypothetical protein n=1 Tax=Streptomyces sp. 21So2-11 TaxID=3144408 RepID=UPI00321B15C9